MAREAEANRRNDMSRLEAGWFQILMIELFHHFKMDLWSIAWSVGIVQFAGLLSAALRSLCSDCWQMRILIDGSRLSEEQIYKDLVFDQQNQQVMFISGPAVVKREIKTLSSAKIT